jgi:tRNA nucleotidyltransferase (CCA-adding enzyme)
MNFLAPDVTQADLVTFATDRVNLKQEDAAKYRTQVNNLREDLDRYITEHPDFDLEKIMLSGSLAKGTALKTLRDVDVALYIKGGDAPQEIAQLLPWIVEKLRATYPQILPANIYVDGPCVVIKFKGTGIDIEIVPVFSTGDPNGRGYLWDRSTGKKVLTSIPQHLEFIRSRKAKNAVHYAQVIRLVKWWIRQREKDSADFAFRSFLAELIVAKLADDGTDFSDYHAALETFFVYVQNSGLKQRIAFTDYYQPSALPAKGLAPVEIFDPVTATNNVADNITESGRRKIVELAGQALDALAYARTCQTKADAIECWRDLMGATFNA